MASLYPMPNYVVTGANCVHLLHYAINWSSWLAAGTRYLANLFQMPQLSRGLMQLRSNYRSNACPLSTPGNPRALLESCACVRDKLAAGWRSQQDVRGQISFGGTTKQASRHRCVRVVVPKENIVAANQQTRCIIADAMYGLGKIWNPSGKKGRRYWRYQ